MIIVLEGPDCAGKSTTAQWLKKTQYPDAIILKQGPPSGDILERYLKPLEDLLTGDIVGPPRIVIFDRWHVGELIYGPLLRNKSLLTPQQADYIDMVMQSFGAWFFHVTAPINVLGKRYDERSDDLIRRDQLLRIQMDYMTHLRPRTHWVMSVPSIDKDVWPKTKLIPTSPMAGQYVGPTNPKVLLLGDERNDDRFIFPFVPTRASSGHWLMGALHSGDVNHMEVGLLNANEVAAHVLYAQWLALGEPPVIPLGRKAQATWRIACGYAPQTDWDEKSFYLNHPQFERRFHYTSMARYGEAIREVIDGQ